jgi:hypothetical protein
MTIGREHYFRLQRYLTGSTAAGRAVMVGGVVMISAAVPLLR